MRQGIGEFCLVHFFFLANEDFRVYHDRGRKKIHIAKVVCVCVSVCVHACACAHVLCGEEDRDVSPLYRTSQRHQAKV